MCTVCVCVLYTALLLERVQLFIYQSLSIHTATKYVDDLRRCLMMSTVCVAAAIGPRQKRLLAFEKRINIYNILLHACVVVCMSYTICCRAHYPNYSSFHFLVLHFVYRGSFVISCRRVFFRCHYVVVVQPTHMYAQAHVQMLRYIIYIYIYNYT
jgi:hypothetical protein